MRRFYISGCGGMLGEAFYALFKDEFSLKCTDIDVNEKWLSHCDVRDFQEYHEDVGNFKPDYLFHLAAHTDLEYCELNQDDAFITNALSVENAVYIANELDIPLFYVSTAGIFNGKKDAYDDWDIPSPSGAYGRSKHIGEIIVRKNARTHLICRPGWMMGGGPKKDKKFVQKLMVQIKAGKKTLHIVNDKLGTPTYTRDFAKNVMFLLEETLMRRELWGLYNMVCEGQTSRLEVAKELLEILGRKDIRIIEVSSDYFKKEYFVPRPESERLINRKLKLRGLNIMRNWKVALREYLEDYYDAM